MGNCRHCDKPIKSKRKGKMYCNDVCCKAFHLAKANAEYAALHFRDIRNFKVCKCGFFFFGVTRNCSLSCGEKKWQTCSQCGKDHYAPRCHSDYCSKQCQFASYGQGICKHCGKTFNKIAGIKNYCSRYCNDAAYTPVGMARRKNAFVEYVYLKDVAERDHYTCQLCGKPVDMSLRKPNFNCPSMDHIQPISKGGKHELSNVQLAHLICNVRKGNRLVA